MTPTEVPYSDSMVKTFAMAEHAPHTLFALWPSFAHFASEGSKVLLRWTSVLGTKTIACVVSEEETKKRPYSALDGQTCKWRA